MDAWRRWLSLSIVTIAVVLIPSVLVAQAVSARASRSLVQKPAQASSTGTLTVWGNGDVAFPNGQYPHTLAEIEPLRAPAVRAAVADARQRAVRLATAFGVHIVGIASIDDKSSAPLDTCQQWTGEYMATRTIWAECAQVKVVYRVR